MNRFFLIGMPGAGKTFWGKQWADASGYSFIDLDEYIETKEQRSIPEIFRASGEPAFRAIERKALEELIAKHRDTIIIACGGGTPVWQDNLQTLKNAGCVIYLHARISTLVRNLSIEKDRRPLLLGQDIEEKLTALFEQRKPIYDQAHHILQVENISVATFAQIQDICTNRH